MDRVVLDEIKPSSPALVQPLALLANFLAFPARRDDIVADLDIKVALTLLSKRGVHDYKNKKFAVVWPPLGSKVWFLVFVCTS